MNTEELLNKLSQKQDLSQKEAEYVLEKIITAEVDASQIAAVLKDLYTKGETEDEIAGFIKVLRKHMITIHAPNGAIDVCGTGGDKRGTFNISTAVALVVAGAGVTVAKHGNRAASSKSGSADVLEELGVNIMLKPGQAEGVLKKVGLVFLFAPLYQPAFKNIAPIRKELGHATVFNYLGPFLNPARVKRQLIGVQNAGIAQKLAKVATKLGYEHLIIVSSADGMDEVSISGATHVFEVKGSKIKSYTIHPSDFGIKTADQSTILGADAKENAEIIKAILQSDKGSKRDIVLINSALALYVAGKVKDMKEGIELAEKSIDSGGAKNVLTDLVKETCLPAGGSQKYV